MLYIVLYNLCFAALVLGDGRVVFKQVTASPSFSRHSVSTPLFTPGAPSAPGGPSQAPQSGLKMADNHFGPPHSPVGVNLNMPKTSLADMVKPAWALSDNVKVFLVFVVFLVAVILIHYYYSYYFLLQYYCCCYFYDHCYYNYCYY